jgi:hypothetical protein
LRLVGCCCHRRQSLNALALYCAAQRVSRGFHWLGVVLEAAASVSFALAMLGTGVNNGDEALDLILRCAIVGIAIYGLVAVIGWVVSGFAAS